MSNMERAQTKAQAQAKRTSSERNSERKEGRTIQEVLDESALFPCKLYEIEYPKILWELINIHPATLYLMYKLATYKKPEEIIKFPIPIYRDKTNWHTALKNFKKMGLVDFGDIELHVIEPHKAVLTPYGRKVVKKWELSPLFKAFEVFDTLNFKSTYHYESIFNDNFVAYKGKEENVFYSEAQKGSSDSKLISQTKTKSSIKIIVDSGFSKVKYKYYIEEKKYNKLVSDDVTVSLKLEEKGLNVIIHPNFKYGNFSISVLYHDDFAECSLDLQKSIDLTNVFIEKRKAKFVLINLSRTESKVKTKKKVRASQSEGSEKPQQAEITGGFEIFDPSRVSKSKSIKVRYQDGKIRVFRETKRSFRRQVYRRKRSRLLQSDELERGQFSWVIMGAYDVITAEYVENLRVEISEEEVRQNIVREFSKFCAQLSTEDIKFYSYLFRRYLKEDFNNCFAGIVEEIEEKRKKRKEDLVKKIRLDFIRLIPPSDSNLTNQLIDPSISVQPDREKIMAQEEVGVPRLANFRLKLTKLAIELGKYGLRNAFFFGIAGCVLYLLFYKISILMYFFRYKIDLMLSLDWEVPFVYVYARFPEMELVSCIVGICVATLPVVILVCRKLHKILKELKIQNAKKMTRF